MISAIDERPRYRSGPLYQCEPKLLYLREIVPHRKSDWSCIGFGIGQVISLSRVNTLDSHRGCVNCARWQKSGTALITGSDDKSVKIWDFAHSYNSMPVKHTVRTSHRSNIFCADFSPHSDNVIVSCAADGTLNKNDLNNAYGEVRLSKADGLM